MCICNLNVCVHVCLCVYTLDVCVGVCTHQMAFQRMIILLYM